MNSAKKWLLLTLLIASGAVSQIGCRACCTPYDYSGPVVGDCHACGVGSGRSGSAVGSPVESVVVGAAETPETPESTVTR